MKPNPAPQGIAYDQIVEARVDGLGRLASPRDAGKMNSTNNQTRQQRPSRGM